MIYYNYQLTKNKLHTLGFKDNQVIRLEIMDNDSNKQILQLFIRIK